MTRQDGTRLPVPEMACSIGAAGAISVAPDGVAGADVSGAGTVLGGSSSGTICVPRGSGTATGVVVG
jgi:hypothetical protein